jgi:hypothetical protein
MDVLILFKSNFAWYHNIIKFKSRMTFEYEWTFCTNQVQFYEFHSHTVSSWGAHNKIIFLMLIVCLSILMVTSNYVIDYNTRAADTADYIWISFNESRYVHTQ